MDRQTIVKFKKKHVWKKKASQPWGVVDGENHREADEPFFLIKVILKLKSIIWKYIHNILDLCRNYLLVLVKIVDGIVHNFHGHGQIISPFEFAIWPLQLLECIVLILFRLGARKIVPKWENTSKRGPRNAGYFSMVIH